MDGTANLRPIIYTIVSDNPSLLQEAEAVLLTVAAGADVVKHQAKRPVPPVQSHRLEVLQLGRGRAGLGPAAVLDEVHDLEVADLARLEPLAGPPRRIDEEEQGHDAQYHRRGALEEEDPAPGLDAPHATQLGDASREEAGEGTRQRCHGHEERQAEGQLVTLVPLAADVHGRGEESRPKFCLLEEKKGGVLFWPGASQYQTQQRLTRRCRAAASGRGRQRSSEPPRGRS